MKYDMNQILIVLLLTALLNSTYDVSAQTANTIAHFNRGSVLYNKGQTELAINEAKKCLKEMSLTSAKIDIYNKSNEVSNNRVNLDFVFAVYKLLISSYQRADEDEAAARSFDELFILVGGLQPFNQDLNKVRKELNDTPLF
jgi:hypothetical protein